MCSYPIHRKTRDDVVRPLAIALQAAGLSVWYDEFELRIGDSLRRKIDKGLASSRFGIVILSQAFFGRGWPEYELDGLVTRAVSGDQVLLPIWHNVSKREVMDYSPSLADRLARSTSTHTVEEIAAENRRSHPRSDGSLERRPLRVWSRVTGCLAHNHVSRLWLGNVRRRKSSTGRHHTPSIRKRSDPR